MRYLFLLFVFAFGCSKTAIDGQAQPTKTLAVFDFQGMHIGDLAPDRIKARLEGKHREFIDEKIEGTKSKVYYTVIDGRIEGFALEYEDVKDAIDVYTKKLGGKPSMYKGMAFWDTTDGLFSIDLNAKTGQIVSQVAVKDGDERHKKELDALGSKL